MIDLRPTLERTLRRAGVSFDSLSFIEFNRSTAHEAALAFLVFLDDEPRPGAMIKITPDPARGAALEAEHRNLTLLASLATPELRSTFPRPLAFESGESLTILAQTAAAGQRMKDFPPDRYFSSPDYREHLERILRWLTALRESTAPAADRLPRRLDARGEIERFRAGFDRSSPADRLLDECAAALDGYDGPTAPWHGDFCTANVLIADDGRPFVIDWEYPLVESWPVADLLYFLTSTWSVPYVKGQPALIENFRSLFVDPNAVVTKALVSMGISEELYLPLSTVSWVLYANRKREELESMLRAGRREDSLSYMPLILFRDGHCLNLELLCET